MRIEPITLATMALLVSFGVLTMLAPGMTVPLLGLIGLGVIAAVGFGGPVAAMAVWLLVVQSTPEMWLSDLIGDHELIIGALKVSGLGIVGLAALRSGARFDRFNPGYAFAFMFVGGLAHGLWPGLGIVASVRSLVGSAAPFASGFLRLSAAMRRVIVRCTIVGPSVTVVFGVTLWAAGMRGLTDTQLGAIRLDASSDAAFLGGFAMIGVFAALVEFLRAGRLREWGWVGINLLILVATGARAPLAMAMVIVLATLLATPSAHLNGQRRLSVLAVGGAVLGVVLMALTMLHFVRVIDLIDLGDAGDLSNRNLIWPYFEAAIGQSPWLGWGVGAGKVIVSLHSAIGRLLGTNAAHNEYLRIGTEGGIVGAVLLVGMMALWLLRGSAALPVGQRRIIRLVFLAFAVQSLTDNTLIATTSLAFFTWARAVFVNPDEGSQAR